MPDEPKRRTVDQLKGDLESLLILDGDVASDVEVRFLLHIPKVDATRMMELQLYQLGTAQRKDGKQIIGIVLFPTETFHRVHETSDTAIWEPGDDGELERTK